MTSPQNLVINYTQTAELLSNVETVEGLAPRWLSISRLVPNVRPETNSSVILLAIDSVLEKVPTTSLPPLFPLINRFYQENWDWEELETQTARKCRDARYIECAS